MIVAIETVQPATSPDAPDVSGVTAPRKSRKSGILSGVLIGALILVLVILPFVLEALSQTNYTLILNRIGIYLILALGLNILVGYAGQLDFGRIAFLAAGGYAASIISAAVVRVLPDAFGPYTFIVAILAGIAGAVVLGGILSLAVLRLRGDYLTIVTLGLGEIVRFIAINNPLHLTGGAQGVLKNSGLSNPVGLQWLSEKIFFPISNNYTLTFTSSSYWFLMVLLFVIVAIIVTRRQENSRTGRAWASLKDDEIAARAMGINTTKTKTSAIMMSVIWGGVAGALFACTQGVVSPKSFEFFNSILVLAIVVIGGMGSTKGVIIGAFIIYGTPDFIRAFAGFGLPFFGWKLTSVESLILLVLIVLAVLALVLIKGKWRRLAALGIVAVIVAELIRATIMGPLGNPLSQTIVDAVASYRNLALGLLMVIMMAWRPDGLIPMVRPRRYLTPESEAKLAGIDTAQGADAVLEGSLAEAGDAA